MVNHKRKVFVVGGDSLVKEMFSTTPEFELSNKIEDDKTIICFTGGEDVTPSLYEEKPISEMVGSNSWNTRRDLDELAVFSNRIANPKIGICRGAQFLNVCSGGSLYQDVDAHCRSHEVYSPVTGKYYAVTSTHHQQMKLNPNVKELGTLLAYAEESTYKCFWSRYTKSEHQIVKLKDGKYEYVSGGLYSSDEIDNEVIFYEWTKSFCFQPHPEYNPQYETKELFMSLLQHVQFI